VVIDWIVKKMRVKNIKLVLRKKIDEWIGSIEDKELQEDVRKNCMVTGGAIASMLLGEEVNDFDVYFTNKETTLKVANYYVDQFVKKTKNKFKNQNREVKIEVLDTDDRIKIMIHSQGIASENGTDEYQYFEDSTLEEFESEKFIDKVTESLSTTNDNSGKKPYRPIFLSSNAITLSDDVQLITRFFGDPKEIHSNYDFVHCTNYWTSSNNHLELNPLALECLLNKELKYIGSKYPIASIIRTRKFINRGFYCNAGEYLKMCWQVNELDLNDLNVLEDQLTGVDFAYFSVLIEALKQKKDKEPLFSLNYNYIIEIIDKIF